MIVDNLFSVIWLGIGNILWFLLVMLYNQGKYQSIVQHIKYEQTGIARFFTNGGRPQFCVIGRQS